ncbi:geranylgeranylglycerol-phosphate geranylgeranyltransferase [Ferruginibacter yonginensis]|uniref:Geranylgeranylglycerol-phosphate geranylgeranyltransferase n=1 Tax=Ferruginibacter yonginensis TaxID=1310416 RepID=A0ABV8QMI9_9BACT
MKLIIAFFRLTRWPNLLFIVITQILFYSCVYLPLLHAQTSNPTQHQTLFILLCVASVCIAAAGYIINDYFDIKIDIVNKPDKIIVNKIIKRRWAIVWHFILSTIGILLSIYIGYTLHEWIVISINFLCVIALWFYSTTFKRKLLSGNIIIAALTAWVILVVYFFVGAEIFSLKGWYNASNNFNSSKLFKITMVYAAFAFITTLIREVVKDLEDMDGDRKYHCNTMPIAWGVPAAKVFTAVWLCVTIAALAVIQLYAWQLGYWLAAVYLLVLVIAPAIVIIYKLSKAYTVAHYHTISNWVKLLMLFGILSMLFFKFM